MKSAGQRRRGGRELLESQFANERQALSDPDQARDMVENLTELKARAERLRGGVSVAADASATASPTFQADVELRPCRPAAPVSRQADEALEASDPAETWDEFQAWLYRRVAGTSCTAARSCTPGPRR